jgi:hypothetical protein
MPTATDLVTDLPADFEVFGQAVATSMGDLLGGTTGQLLSKTSNTDMDFTWATPSDLISTTNLSGASTTVSFPSGGYKNLLFVFSEMLNNTADGAVTCYFNAGTTSNSGVYTTGTTSTSYNDTTVRLSNNLTLNRANPVNCIALNLVNFHNVYQAFQVFGGWFQGGRFNVIGGGQVTLNILTSMTVSNSGGTFSAGFVSMYGTR